MVTAGTSSKRFAHDDRGIVLLEALLVVPILLLILAAMIEFSMMMMQWNRASKALQVGARLATVSAPLIDISSLDTYATGTTGAAPPTTTYLTVRCGYGTTPCDATQLTRIYAGQDTTCDQQGLPGICDFAPFINRENLLFSYHRSNLGYVGRPSGPVLTVTVELRNETFDFLILDNILSFFVPLGGPSGIAIPSYPVSLTSEDLCNGALCP